ncbi:MAG: hypothetical protein ABID64_03655 [Nitrospirota bacterium]
MNMKEPNGAEGDPGQEVIEARRIILEFLERGQRGAGHSQEGYRSSSEGPHEAGFYDAEDRGEAYAEYIEIFSIEENIGDDTSLVAYLTAKCQVVMLDPETRWRQLMDFIEREFGISVKPAEGPTPFYDGCMEGLAEQISETNPDITVDDVKEFLPFKTFNGYGKGEIGEAVREVLHHFKNRTDE